ncbi:MAG: glutathione S-transferase family protein [Rhodospirillaceae bacterium]|nr:glutathione S-transferase family protein [Rhodospirillaceae bacterium]MBT6858727.1 glutathione S-transferase family protein [Rhodospirillaceae bacterium]MBT7569862.1 glutathione S-transferase family protein [Rhodospirillaceae bacterium]
MKFYDMALAPSPRRVRMFIAEKGIDIPVVQVDLRGGEHLRPEFAKLNPWCTVPVLELDDGTCISEAIACCRYLEAAFPEPPLMGATPVEQGVIAMWEHRVEWDGFIAGAEMLRNSAERLKGRALTGAESFEQIPELAERGRKRIAVLYEMLDKRFGESEYLAGDSFTVADITALIAIDFVRRQKLEIPEERPHVQRWHDAISARPSAQL